MKVKIPKNHPTILAIAFVVLSIIVSIYVGIMLEKAQIFAYQRLSSVTLYQGGYLYFVISLLLLSWMLGLYHALKKKVLFLLLPLIFVLFIFGTLQKVILTKRALIITLPFSQKELPLDNVERLTIKYVETKTNQRISQCSDLFYLITKEGDEVSLENFVFPAEKLFKDIKSSHGIPIVCELHYWKCDYQKYPSHSNLSSHQLCEETRNLINNN